MLDSSSLDLDSNTILELVLVKGVKINASAWISPCGICPLFGGPQPVCKCLVTPYNGNLSPTLKRTFDD